MSETQSPFLVREIPCPSCEKLGTHRIVRKRAVSPIQKESDQHVTEYKWSSTKIHQVHPPFYFLHYCTECHYVDTIEDFADPESNEYSRWTLKAHSTAVESGDETINLISEPLLYGELDFDSAFRLHLLATYIQLLSPQDVLDNYKIARLLLRTAWLYRELEERVSQSKSAKPDSNSDDMAADPHAALLNHFDENMQSMYAASSKWESLCDAVTRHLELQFDESEIAFEAEMSDVREAITHANQKMNQAKNACLKHIAAETEQIEARSTGSEFVTRDASFLNKLKLLWPLAPENEIEAMRAATRYFERALSSDPRLDSMDAYFQVASLSVDLLMRCGDIDAAFGFVRGIHSNAMEARQGYMEKLRDDDIDDDTKRKTKGLLKRTTESLECAVELRAELMNKLVERERPKIESILNKAGAPNGKSAESVLIEGGVPVGLINYIKDPKNRHELAGRLAGK